MILEVEDLIINLRSCIRKSIPKYEINGLKWIMQKYLEQKQIKSITKGRRMKGMFKFRLF